MTKLVINTSLGGFTLSRNAFLRLRELCNEYALQEIDVGEKFPDGSVRDEFCDGFLDYIPRDDPDLLRVVDEMGPDAWGPVSKLKVVEIPDDVEWAIDDDNGRERVHEKHRAWS